MSASGSASSSSSVSSAPAALASALASNGLCAPAALGDPFTALMIDAKRHFLVSGTATGRVSAWAIPHLTLARRAPRDLDDAQRAAVAEVRAAIAADQFPAAALAKGSDEGIRSIFTIGERVFALVGDVNAKTWSSYDAQGYQLIKYRRIHTANMCHLTFTLQHEANIVLLQRDAMNEGLLIDLQLGEQKAFPFVLGSRSTPVSFDGQRLVVVTNASTAVTGSGEPAPRLSQEICIFNVKSNQQLMRITTNIVDQFYWGFQLVGDLLVYVSKLACVKAIRLPRAALDGGSDGDGSGGGSGGGPVLAFDGIARDDVVYRCDTGARILTFVASAGKCVGDGGSGLRVWTLSADQCVRYFENGELKRTYANLCGEIGAMGYPHIMRVCDESNFLFYTADDGIYYLDLAAET